MKIHDSLNNQFKLHNYIVKLNPNLLQYLDNNNIDINYYCFFSKIVDEKHYIITSQTTKHILNGYRLITAQDVEKENNIFEHNNSMNIIFENIYIKVTSIVYDINDITKELDVIIVNFYSHSVYNEIIDCAYAYDKNILENNVTHILNATNLYAIKNFENLKELDFA